MGTEDWLALEGVVRPIPALPLVVLPLEVVLATGRKGLLDSEVITILGIRPIFPLVTWLSAESRLF